MDTDIRGEDGVTRHERVRRVVTGHRHGRAVFASDELVDPITVAILPGYSFHRLWGSDEVPRFPDDGSPPAQPDYFPPIGGFRFGLFCIPPDSTTLTGGSAAPDLDLSTAIAELDAKLPGMTSYAETEEAGMHTTPTIDFEVVLAGECVLELDDGAEVELKPGDVVVQNGTRHRWHNRSNAPCQLAVFIIGAHHES
jgi:mannose-6-phosphate isomerase-like protein (cupin superfamily)